MTYQHKLVDGERFYNGILPPTMTTLTGRGDAPNASECKDLGVYSRDVVRFIDGIKPEVIAQFPENWKMGKKQLIHKFLHDHIPYFRKGESVKANLGIGTILAGPDGWSLLPTPGASFGRVAEHTDGSRG